MNLKLLIGAPIAALVGAFLIIACDDGHKDDGHNHGTHNHQASNTAQTSATDDGYPLKTCVVSDEDLGSMGDPITMDHNGTTVKFCCKSCIDDFKEAPEKYLAKLKAAGDGSS
tara:strand:- start:3050 stop:3388 length:339 start_codon:yes stop_codon:yes gene_type:complete